ncbi:MAG: hypothetical protein ABIJ47_07385 [Candidatus Bathyarchaeota archaeon]
MAVGNNEKKPEEMILIEDLKDMDNLLQVCKRDIETMKNKTKIIRSLLVMARENITQAIELIDKMVEGV